MSWSDLYLVCFIVGFGLSVVAFLAGSVHLHLPHLHLQHGIHVPVRGGLVKGGMAKGGGRGSELPWFNFGTIAAFLAWFGGTGYLLQHYYGVWIVVTLGIATVSGIGGASVVFWFLAKVLMARETVLDSADYEMVGVLGKLSIGIRAGGTGELVYTQQGTRRVTGARSEDGSPIERGLEVMVTRYEKGIAYVRPWEDPLIAQFKDLK
jgi:hypothetical protein